MKGTNMDKVREALASVTHMLARYVSEVPLGHQPHMAALQAQELLLAAREALSEQPAEPEAQFEAFIQAAISSAPEPLRELGEFLARRLDEDQWPTAERYLLAIATQPAEHPKLRAIFAHWNEFGPEHGFGELMDRLQAPQPAPSEPAAKFIDVDWDGSRPMRQSSAPSEPAVLQDAFRAGWRTAANWMERDDLIADIGSPAYLKDMADALSPLAASPQPPKGSAE